MINYLADSIAEPDKHLSSISCWTKMTQNRPELVQFHRRVPDLWIQSIQIKGVILQSNLNGE